MITLMQINNFANKDGDHWSDHFDDNTASTDVNVMSQKH